MKTPVQNPMHIERHHPKTLAYIRITGPYGKGYEEPIDRLYQWAGRHGLSGGECLFIYLDNPETTPGDQCRTDLCLTVPADAATGGEIEKQHIPGGTYAVIRRTVNDPVQYAQRQEADALQGDYREGPGKRLAGDGRKNARGHHVRPGDHRDQAPAETR